MRFSRRFQVINVIEKNSKKYNDSKLISVYSLDGKLIRKIGDIIKCNSHIGYNIFNTVIMSIIDNRVYCAFQNYPFVSEFDTEGHKSVFIDLRKKNIKEIGSMTRRTAEMGLDTPETIKADTDTSIRHIIHCYGFGVDKEMRMYYVINAYEPNTPNKSTCYVLQNNRKGKPLNKLYFKSKGETVQVRELFIDDRNILYGIGSIKEKIVLFKPETRF